MHPGADTFLDAACAAIQELFHTQRSLDRIGGVTVMAWLLALPDRSLPHLSSPLEVDLQGSNWVEILPQRGSKIFDPKMENIQNPMETVGE